MVTLSSNFFINLQLENAITGDADKKLEYNSQTKLYISEQVLTVKLSESPK